MQLSGHLAAFPVSNLLQWAATERTSGILVVAAGPGYRLRFDEGRLVAASCWCPTFRLDRLLLHRRQIGSGELGMLQALAEKRDVSLAEILAESSLIQDLPRILGGFVAEIVYSLLREKDGTFFVDAAAQELPSSLRVPIEIPNVLFEGIRRLDDESKLAQLIPKDSDEIELVRFPRESGQANRRTLQRLLQLLGQHPRSMQSILDEMPADPNLIRLIVAELLREGALASRPGRGDAPRPAPVPRVAGTSCLRQRRKPTPEERPFLTRGEAALLEQAAETSNAEMLAGRLGFSEAEILSMLQPLLTAGLLQLVPPRRRVRLVPAAAAVGALLLAPAVVLLGHSPAPATDARPPVSAPSPTPFFDRLADAAEALDAKDPLRARLALEGVPPNLPAAGPLRQRLAELELHAQQVDAAIQAAYDAIAAGDLDAAAGAAEQARELAPDADSVRDLDGRLETARTARFRAAAQEQERRQALWQQRDELLVQARRAIQSGSRSEATRLLGRAAALVPGDPEIARLQQEAQRPAPRATPRPAAKAPPAPPTAPLPTPPPTAVPQPTPAPIAELIVNAVPYAQVRIAGRELGVTPLRLSLPVGRYELELYREGYRTQRRSVTLGGSARTVEAFTMVTEEESAP
jgi:hypothetical protein